MFGNVLLGFVLTYINNFLTTKTMALKTKLYVVAYQSLATLPKGLNEAQIKKDSNKFFTMPKALVVNYEHKYT